MGSSVVPACSAASPAAVLVLERLSPHATRFTDTPCPVTPFASLSGWNCPSFALKLLYILQGPTEPHREVQDPGLSRAGEDPVVGTCPGTNLPAPQISVQLAVKRLCKLDTVKHLKIPERFWITFISFSEIF